ncbi:hypothetical protein ABZ379_06715 [Streptomyces canus]|uniref:hypothetical protein n=1 Tax=Streptomyces canus TaxID=58343 RepID=UPI0033FE00D4
MTTHGTQGDSDELADNVYIAQRQLNLQGLCATPDEVVNALAKLCRAWGAQF